MVCGAFGETFVDCVPSAALYVTGSWSRSALNSRTRKRVRTRGIEFLGESSKPTTWQALPDTSDGQHLDSLVRFENLSNAFSELFKRLPIRLVK